MSGERRLVAVRSPEFEPIREGMRRSPSLVAALNALPTDSDDATVRAAFSALLGRPVDPTFRLRLPFRADDGRGLSIGQGVFVNHDCACMDLGRIEIGDEVMIGPNVTLISAGHPVDPARRRTHLELAPVRIERGVWIGAGATVLPGVTIGADSVVGAGSVVTRDVPPGVVVAGNPARVLRSIDDRGV